MLRLFVAMRLLVGGATFLAPGLAARLLRLDGPGPQSAYWARLFGVRDVALGVAALRTTGTARAEVIGLTAACDAVDAASALLARRAGFPATATTLATLTAITAGAVAAGARAESGSGTSE